MYTYIVVRLAKIGDNMTFNITKYLNINTRNIYMQCKVIPIMPFCHVLVDIITAQNSTGLTTKLWGESEVEYDNKHKRSR